jgi:hypothetical protein
LGILLPRICCGIGILTDFFADFGEDMSPVALTLLSGVFIEDFLLGVVGSVRAKEFLEGVVELLLSPKRVATLVATFSLLKNESAKPL